MKSHVTRHIQKIVDKGTAQPLFAEHKAELDKIDMKDRAAASLDATDSAEENQSENEMRGVVAHPPPPAGMAEGLQLPAYKDGARARATPPCYQLGTSRFQFP